MKLSVIVPVHNNSDSLNQCLAGLTASSRPPDEIIIMDDASTDGSGDLALQFGVKVIRVKGSPKGPAFCRNRSAEIATGDILVFIDADVVVHTDTLEKIENYLTEEKYVAALFGLYDSHPTAQNFVSRYKNLFHHYIHKHSHKEASTFWAGCGAVRRKIFLKMRGFDENYSHPMIEDIELGTRLRVAGYRIWLCHDIQVTHLKHWTFFSLIRSDIFDRAVPWTLLIMRNRQLPSDLNLSPIHRFSALGVWSIMTCFIIGFWINWMWIGVLVLFIGQVLLNSNLYKFFLKKGGGLLFTIKAIVLHSFYLFYSSFAFALTVIFSSTVICKRKSEQ